MSPQRWRRVERIGSLIAEVLPARVRRNMAGWQAVELWSQVAGPDVARRTAAVAFRDGRLTVEVVNSAWIQRLSSSSRRYLESLNQAIDGAQVTEIIYRVNPALVSRQETGSAEPTGPDHAKECQ